MVNRQQFKYTACLIIKYLVSFVWCRDLDKNRHNKSIKPHFFFEKCEEKLNKELDILHLMRQSRTTKMLTQILLDQKQKLLLKFQRKNMIETSSESEDSDDQTRLNMIKLMDNKNPLIRLSVFGRMKRMLNTYKKQKLDITDRRLVRGLYMRNLKDFDEHLKIQSRVSLLDRLLVKDGHQISSRRTDTKDN